MAAGRNPGLTDYGGYWQTFPDGTTRWIPDVGPQRPTQAPTTSLAPRAVAPPQFAVPGGVVPWPSGRTSASTLTPVGPAAVPVYPAVPTPAVYVPPTATTTYALPAVVAPAQLLPPVFYAPGESTPIFIPTESPAAAVEPQMARVSSGKVSWWWLLLLAAGGYAAWKESKKRRRAKAE